MIANHPWLYNVQEEEKSNDVAWDVPWIYVAVDKRQVGHQALVIKMEGMVNNQSIIILIDLDSNYIYVGPWVADKCAFHKISHERS